MGECLRESGLQLPEIDVQALAFALYSDALGDDRDDSGGINFEQLRRALDKQEGLLDNLTFVLSKWIVPEQKQHEQKETCCAKVSNCLRKVFTGKYYQNRKQLLFFFSLFFILNIAIFGFPAYQLRGIMNLNGSHPNWFYIMARGNGRVLNFNSSLLLLLVLRYSITKLRELGFGVILPLDENIYIHQFVGVIIFIQSFVHTAMHILNFMLNIAPDPVTFVQINNDYWSVSKHYDGDPIPNWAHLGYKIPPGCNLTTVCGNKTEMMAAKNLTFCQVCDDGSKPWNIIHWFFTTKPGVFGLIGGWANPTGFALIAILIVMVACSMPCVRRSGKFEVFYFTHLLYMPFYILLILHAPNFWKWALGPLLLFILERLYRLFSTFVGHGHSQIVDADILASKVTSLTIRRPDGFKFCPGDWVFIRIPEIARHEWHPFTISSAPEQEDNFTLHVRGVGEWTNRLYNFFEEKINTAGIRSRQQFRLSKRESIYSRYRVATQQTRQHLRKRHGGDAGYDLPEVVVDGRGSKKIESQISKLQDPPLNIYIDGPFGAPASNIFRAEHAVLIATGIGVTPFSSILQSIMYRYLAERRECPRCQHKWTDDFSENVNNLKKVDFIWINRDQKSFEWFVELLSDMESAQGEEGGVMDNFLDFHLYFTAALQRTDIRAVGLQLAMDLVHRKEQKDLVTKLKTRTNAGRPNWDQIFNQMKERNCGNVTVFYCGNPQLARTLKAKCEDFGFDFRKEIF